MASEEIYDLCLPILDGSEEDEEEKAEKLESFLRDQQSLTGAVLENAVLDVLWRHRKEQQARASSLPAAPAPLRHTVIRRASPAPWQVARSSTPLSTPSNAGSSPVTSSAYPILFRGSSGGGGGAGSVGAGNGFSARTPRSVTGSPFTSPRPSPRLALAQPIPHSPSLSAYTFSERSVVPDIYGDYGSDIVDWLVNDDAGSVTSSTSMSATAPEWVAPPDMSPYDILRSVVGERKTNEEIEQALEANRYDLGATIASLTEADQTDGQNGNNTPAASETGRVIIGKSMVMEPVRPVTPSGSARTPAVCKYWLSSGQCLRANCRFSHDLTSHVCKYWLVGNCLAADSCPFSHDPSALIGNLNMNNNTIPTGPQSMQSLQDPYDGFPSLQSTTNEQWRQYTTSGSPQSYAASSPGIRHRNLLNQSSRSRPTSRHQQNNSNSSLAVDDHEAFPTLSALNARGSSSKKHLGKRGGHAASSNTRDSNGGGSRKNSASSMADVARMSPSNRKGVQRPNRTSIGSSRDVSGPALAIPAPKHIPWLDGGAQWNQLYLKFRLEAITHGNVRNKFLQSAGQAWNRNDARAAKALSLRGQAENDAMRRCHREAARVLYDESRKNVRTNDNELYIDLHGLAPTEAIGYVDSVFRECQQLHRLDQSETKDDGENAILYIITGSGHQSKNGKDKIGRVTRGWLVERRFVFREFSVPGERGGFVAFVIGVDPLSARLVRGGIKAKVGQNSNDGEEKAAEDGKDNGENGDGERDAERDTSGETPVLVPGKVQLLKREESRG